MLILKAVSLGPLYGCGILLRIEQVSRGALRIEQGALYPALFRLVRHGLLKTNGTRLKRGVSLAQARRLRAADPVALRSFPSSPGWSLASFEQMRVTPTFTSLKASLLGDIGGMRIDRWIELLEVGALRPFDLAIEVGRCGLVASALSATRKELSFH